MNNVNAVRVWTFDYVNDVSEEGQISVCQTWFVTFWIPEIFKTVVKYALRGGRMQKAQGKKSTSGSLPAGCKKKKKNQ